jgi:hypothetical protein
MSGIFIPLCLANYVLRGIRSGGTRGDRECEY